MSNIVWVDPELLGGKASAYDMAGLWQTSLEAAWQRMAAEQWQPVAPFYDGCGQELYQAPSDETRQLIDAARWDGRISGC